MLFDLIGSKHSLKVFDGFVQVSWVPGWDGWGLCLSHVLSLQKFRSLGRAALETPCEPHRRCAGMMRGRIRRHQGVVRAERPKAGLVFKNSLNDFW